MPGEALIPGPSNRSAAIGVWREERNAKQPPGGAQYDGQRWQYAVINLGMFKVVDRLERALGWVGSQGWEIAAAYDKASNWWGGMEKGFILLKRPVTPDMQIPPDEWCVTLDVSWA